MSLWGTKDTKTVTGTVDVTQNSVDIAGTGTAFTTELKTGQTLVIAGVEYKVDSIASDTAAKLHSAYAGTTAAGLTVTATEEPAYVMDSERANVVGVSVAEAQNANNRAAGIKTPGWTKTVTYTDAQGNTRNKSEILVAFGGDIVGDAADDAVVSDRVITITTQPTATSAVEGETATFTVVASVSPSTTISYQWQKQEAGTTTWANVVGATLASYTTGVLAVAADSGDKYRVVLSAADARSINSRSATLTVTAA